MTYLEYVKYLLKNKPILKNDWLIKSTNKLT